LVSGTSSGAVVDQLDRDVITVGRDGDDRYLVRAADWLSLGAAINATERPPGTRIRVEVDPPRV
jgi:primosomal protein N' (replication factor Y) (superfamily II helicase)